MTPQASHSPSIESNGATLSDGQEAVANTFKDELSEDLRHVSAEAQHVVSDVTAEVKKATETKLAAGKDFAAGQLGAVANAIRKTADDLRTQDSGLTDYAVKAATSVDTVSHYLQTRTLSQLIGDAEGYARREPALFMGGAFLVGLIGGRFLKSATPALSPEARSDTGRRGQTGAQRRGQPPSQPHHNIEEAVDLAMSREGSRFAPSSETLRSTFSSGVAPGGAPR